MSLAQHIGDGEGVDYDPDADGSPITRQLSYDPFPEYSIPEQTEHHITGSYEVPRWKRIAQVVFGVISCVLASGMVFGYAALKPLLVDQGYYSEMCHETLTTENNCFAQKFRLNLVFTVSVVTTNVSALPVGAFFDHFGPRLSSLLGSVILAIGTLLVSFDQSIPFLDGLLLGYFCLALGGTFIFIPSFHLSNAFPKSSGTIVALVTGAFDASAAVFLVYRLIYEATDGSFNIHKFFLVYLIVPVVIFISQVTFMPAETYKTAAQLDDTAKKTRKTIKQLRSHRRASSPASFRRQSIQIEDGEQTLREIQEAIGTKQERLEEMEKQDERRLASDVWGALHGVPARNQLKTAWFYLMALFTVVQMIRMTFFIATIRSQYIYMLGSDFKAEVIESFFDWALPIGGIVTVPFIGYLLDKCRTVVLLLTLVVFTVLFGVFGNLQYTWAAYINICLFVIFRPLYYSVMSDYAAKVFGFLTFGRIYGTIICFSGILSFLQQFLDALTHTTFHDNPTPVNVALAVCGIVSGTALIAFVQRHTAAVHLKMDPERQSLLSRQASRQFNSGSAA